uniref:V-set and transmembrane domain containing 2A n=1 Tax=Rousettus aegyptiacus TaxID=9407 RepID=A0A7J8D8W1_ROUAE|nr:V-set and transmembrane domain containing 2A [Rousettus aegyptiacus]
MWRCRALSRAAPPRCTWRSSGGSCEGRRTWSPGPRGPARRWSSCPTGTPTTTAPRSAQ